MNVKVTQNKAFQAGAAHGGAGRFYGGFCAADLKLPRRHFLALGLGLALSANRAQADEPMVCAKSYAGDPERRASLHYMEQSSDPAKKCDACQYFESRGSCGNCRILETLVNPAGTCDSWSHKAE